MEEEWDEVSVVIPIYNPPEKFGKLVQALCKQSLKPVEIILIDSSPQKKEAKWQIETLVKYIPISPRDFDHGATRTKGAQISQGDAVVFLSQDVEIFEDSSFEKLILPLIQNPKIGRAFGRQIPHPKAHFFARSLREFNYPETSYVRSLDDRKKYGIKTAFFSDSFSVYRKSALEKIGWFDEGLIMGEDVVAAAKMLIQGYFIAYSAEARVYHSHNFSMWEEFLRYKQVGQFHRQVPWLLKTFGKAEGEGMRYIKYEFSKIRNENKGKALLFIQFVLRNSLKWLGYRLGKSGW